MRVVLIGYGKMGEAIDQIAAASGVEVVARIDPAASEADYKEITSEAVADAEVCIDFSNPDAVLDNLKALAPCKKQIVIGTTGWYEQIEMVRDLVEEFNLGVIYAQNFSLGMNLFARIVEEAAKLINRFEDYDVSLNEIHHRQKVDSPSGTAFAIAEVLIENINRKKKINCDQGEVSPEELHVSSIRVGTVPGTHTVICNSKQDTITLTHQAHNRLAWAQGALEAAKWIQNKQGLYTLNHMLEAPK